MEQFFGFILDLTRDWGYLGIIFLMTVESSFLPLPSEIVIPPAAYLAYQGELNVYLVVICGVIGSLLGAILNYSIAMFLGRPLVYSIVEKRWARLFLLSKKSLEKSERYFLKYGEVSTFLGRLLPVIRHLISLPAGFVRMKFASFVIFTVLGSALWVSVLAALGYFFGANQELFEQYYSEVALVLIGLVVLVASVYAFLKMRARKRVTSST